MKRTYVMRCILFAGLIFAYVFDARAQRDTSGLQQAVDNVFAEWNLPNSPGCAVVLTDGGKVVLTRSYGMASLEHTVPISRTTRFELASVSKPFTAFGLMLLEKAGRVSLDDTIQKYLTELPDYGFPVTIADLLHHTSGISDWGRVLAYAGRPGRAGFGVDDLMRLVARQRMLEFTPGTRWSYSNTNYALLAEIISRITEMPFGDWMKQNVFGPLEMHSTSFPVDGARVLPNRASAYYRNPDGELVRSQVEEFEIPGPAHAFSTIDDMALWVDNLRTGRVGGFDLIGKMQKRTTLTTGEQPFYAAGLGMGEYRGIRTAGHSGQTGSFKTELLYCPDIAVGVVVLGNAGWMGADQMARRVLDVYLVDELDPLPEAVDEPEEIPFIDMDPAGYDPFIGGYRPDSDPSMLLAVAREGRWLVGMIVGFGTGLFRPVAPTTFENRNRSFRLEFIDEPGKDATERVRMTRKSGQVMLATRVKLPPDAPLLKECVGLYYSDELVATYEILGAPDGLTVVMPNGQVRPLYQVDKDVIMGMIGIFMIRRDKQGRITGFDFGEPEDFSERMIRFVRIDGSR